MRKSTLMFLTFVSLTVQIASKRVNVITSLYFSKCSDTSITPSYTMRTYQRCCTVQDPTVINETDFTIFGARDDQVEVISIYANRKIEFLPILVFQKFPNLVRYAASECSVKEIFKKNFERLKKLNLLILSLNQIQKIRSNTFEKLTELKWIDLSNNEIKFLGTHLFEGLKLVKWVNLRSNKCIDLELEGENQIQNFTAITSQNCTFDEPKANYSKLFDVNCGTVEYNSGLIIGGNVTKRGQWPFLTALLTAVHQQFFCAGNLITNQHVLTAAHCMQEKNVATSLQPDEVVVLLGRYNLKLIAERGSEFRDVDKIILHPEWKNFTVKYDADLALIVMNQPVEFSKYIQPVCLATDPEILSYDDGFVVGWGKSEGPSIHETIPRQIPLRAVENLMCLVDDYRIAEIASLRTFCAGGDGVTPCLGDSGGGFFVRFRGLWTLKGTVSAALINTLGLCNVTNNVLFTKIIDFNYWIQSTVNRNS